MSHLPAHQRLRRSFFFSSRRRHTRLQGDWSSDVCSSDLRLDAAKKDLHPNAALAFLVPSMILMLRGVLDFSALNWWRLVAYGALLAVVLDRKSTRLNSSHLVISYAVFCLKKKKNLAEHSILDRYERLTARNEVGGNRTPSSLPIYGSRTASDGRS